MTDKNTSRPTGYALVVFYHGEGYVILWQADAWLEDLIKEFGGHPEGFDLEACCVGYTTPKESGVYIGNLTMDDAGPGDLPYLREAAVGLDNLRPVTAEEWQRYRNEEWPWDFKPLKESEAEAVSAADIATAELFKD